MSLIRNIVVAVTGGIAAYKSAVLVRLLIKHGYQVRVVMTQSAKAFVQPLTFQALTAHRVYDDLLDDQTDNGMAHIDLAKWADCIVVAPASSNSLAKLSLGLADDLLGAMVLATQAKLVIAPAMNQAMWRSAVTQQHTQTLQHRGAIIAGPDQGEQACGDTGPGRLLEPEAIVDVIQTLNAPQSLLGQHWVVTAGPTHEAIDPVRYISNYSSGKMGFAIAQAAQQLGAAVTLVAGPCSLQTPRGVRRVDVVSACDMHEAVLQAMPTSHGFISAAAVADYRIEQQCSRKIKKTEGGLNTLALVENPDIVADVAQRFANARVVGFALETQDVLSYAQQKLQSKQLDAIVANQLGKDARFGDDEHAAVLLFADGRSLPLVKQSKLQLAQQLMLALADSRVTAPV